MPRKVRPEFTIPQAQAVRVGLTMAAESEDEQFAQTAERALAELDRVKRTAERAAAGARGRAIHAAIEGADDA